MSSSCDAQPPGMKPRPDRAVSWDFEDLKGRARQRFQVPATNAGNACVQDLKGRARQCFQAPATNAGNACVEDEIDVQTVPSNPSAGSQMRRRAHSFGITCLRQASFASDFDEVRHVSTPTLAGGTDRRPSMVFANAEEMKEKVRLSLHRPVYSVYDSYKQEGCCQAIAKSQRFESLALFVVAMNSIWIAIDTDYNDQDDLMQADIGFQAVQHLFCGFFVFEWAVRFMAFQRKCAGFRDPWFALDSVLVALMVFDTWVMSAVLLANKGKLGFLRGEANSSILRLLRLIRLFRMARVARLLHATPELVTLIKAMAAALRSVFFTLCLLIAVMYVFAVGFTQTVADTPMGRIHFPTVAESMYTLLMHGTLLCNVSGFMDEVRATNPIVAAMVLIFILISAVTVMNMLVGILCDVVSAVAASEREELAVDLVRSKLQGILYAMDRNKDSVISKAEFASLLENSAATKALQEVGVDPVGLIDNADIIFEDEIGDEFDKELTFQDFMEIVLEMRGSRAATVKDIVNLRKYIRKSAQQTGEHMARLEKRLHKLVAQSSRLRASRARCIGRPGHGDAAGCGKCKARTAHEKPPTRSAERAPPASSKGMRANLQVVKATLEADLAAVLTASQHRPHKRRQSTSCGDTQICEAASGGVAAADGEGGSIERSGGKEAAEPITSSVRSKLDPVQLSCRDAESSGAQPGKAVVTDYGHGSRGSGSGGKEAVLGTIRSSQLELGLVKQSPAATETSQVQQREVAAADGGSGRGSKDVAEPSFRNVPSESESVGVSAREIETSRVQPGPSAFADSDSGGSSGGEEDVEPIAGGEVSGLDLVDLSFPDAEPSQAQSEEAAAADSSSSGGSGSRGEEAVQLITDGLQSEHDSVETSLEVAEAVHVLPTGVVVNGGGGSGEGRRHTA